MRKVLKMNYDVITICPYCQHEVMPLAACCGEVHKETHYYDFEHDMFVNKDTGGLTNSPSQETMV